MAIVENYWQPGFYVDGTLGPNGNSYRSILQLEVGDMFDLKSVIADAENIKSAVVWRTKDGWEMRGTTYSGGYGVSIEPKELEEDRDLFDKILIAFDSEPPFKDRPMCACGCKSPSKSEFLTGHKTRVQSQFDQPKDLDQTNPEVEDPGVEDPEVEVKTPEAETPIDGEQVGQSGQSDVTNDEESAQDAESTEPEQAPPDSYDKYLDETLFGEQEATKEEEPKAIPALDVQDVMDALDRTVANEAMAPSGIDISIALANLRDPYVEIDPFPKNDKCQCGCGNSLSREGKFVGGHSIRQKMTSDKFDLPKPSNDRMAVEKYAYMFALGESGYYKFDEPLDSRGFVKLPLDGQINIKRLQYLWQNRKAFYISLAENMLDAADVDKPLYEIAADKMRFLAGHAIKSGSLAVSIVADNQIVKSLNGNEEYSLNAMLSGSDKESQAPVSDVQFVAYRNSMEFDGQDFDPLAKYYNYIWLSLVRNELPFKLDEELNEDHQVAAIQVVTAVSNGSLNENKQFKDDFANWWTKHGHKAYGYSPPPEFKIIAKIAQDYARTLNAGFSSKKSTVKYQTQSISKLIDEIEKSKTPELGKSLYFDNSPFRGDYLTVCKIDESYVAFAQFDEEASAEAMGKLLDQGAVYKDNTLRLEYEDGEIYYFPHSNDFALSQNKQRLEAIDWIEKNIGNGPYSWVGVKDENRTISLIFGNDGRVVWVNGNASEGLLARLTKYNKKYGTDFMYNKNEYIRYANITSKEGYLLFKQSDKNFVLDDQILTSLKDSDIELDKIMRLTLERNNKLVGRADREMTYGVFSGLFVKKHQMKLAFLNTNALSRTIKFQNLSLAKVYGWLSSYFNLNLSRIATSANNGRPTLYDKTYQADSKPQMGETGIVYKFGKNIKELLEVVEFGAVLSASDHALRQKDTKTLPLNDKYVYASYGSVGGQEYLSRYKHALVFKTDLAFSDGAILTEQGGSPEIGISNQLNLSDVVALVVPAEYSDMADMKTVINRLKSINLDAQVFFVSGDDKQLRKIAANIASSYNEQHGFDDAALFRDNFSSESRLFDVVIEPDDALLIKNSGTYLPILITSIQNDQVKGRLMMTPRMRKMLAEDPVANSLAKFVNDKQPIEVDVPISNIAWLSKKVN